MRYWNLHEQTDLKEVKRDGNTRLYAIETLGVKLPCLVMARQLHGHWRVEIGQDLRYTGGTWGFDHIFAFWTNFGLAQPASKVFGLEDEQREALHMDRVFTNIREAKRGVKDWLLEEDGIMHLQESFVAVAKVQARQTQRLAKSAELFGMLHQAIYGEGDQ